MFNIFLFIKRVIVSIITIIPFIFISKFSSAASLTELIEGLYKTDLQRYIDQSRILFSFFYEKFKW